jgi:RNA polymerase sigma-70 factor (ECF subfamily)
MNQILLGEQFIELVTSHQRRLEGYVRTLVPNRADAEEILQEVNLYLCRHANEFQLGTDFPAWALRITHFCVLNWRERRSRDRLIFDESLLARLASSVQELAAAGDSRREALEACLRKLAPRDHDLVTQLYGDPKTTPQSLAKRMGRSTKGIYESLYRIRMRLHECIQRTLTAENRAG